MNAEAITRAITMAPIEVEDLEKGFTISITVTPKGGIPIEMKANVKSVPAHLGRVTIPIADAKNKPKTTVKAGTGVFIGAAGDRNVFKLTLTRVKQHRTGTTTEYFYTFLDEEGNTLLWSTHRDKRMMTGNEYTVKATIRSHLERRGENITLITRGRIIQ